MFLDIILVTKKSKIGGKLKYQQIIPLAGSELSIPKEEGIKN